MIVSNCCGAVAEVTSEDIGICPECYEHCVFEDDEDDEDKRREYDEYLNQIDTDWYHPNNDD